MTRADFAFSFGIAPGAGQARRTNYEDHVDQMIRQILLTDPRERVCLPDYGAGLRRLLFSPLSVGLESTTQLLVTQSLTRWLGDQIVVRKVSVLSAEDGAPGAGLPDGAVVVQIDYELIETRTVRRVQAALS